MGRRLDYNHQFGPWGYLWGSSRAKNQNYANQNVMRLELPKMVIETPENQIELTLGSTWAGTMNAQKCPFLSLGLFLRCYPGPENLN